MRHSVILGVIPGVMLVLATAVIATGGNAPAALRPAPVKRYAYALGCDGIVDKVDTVGTAPRSQCGCRQASADRA